MKGATKYILLVGLLLVLFSCSTILHYMMTGVGSEESKNQSILLATRIHDAIEAKLQGPIQVSKMMAKDEFLFEKIKSEKTMPAEEFDSQIKSYLSTIKQGESYATAFLVSDATRRYYTYSGAKKEIDTKADELDAWYSEFVKSQKKYALFVENDLVNNEILTVFVDSRMEDDKGNLLGVCGVGIAMSEIQNMMSEWEEEYHIEVNIVNAQGLDQSDTGSLNIETAYLIDQMMSDKSDFVYTNKGDGYVITKYMQSADWYLTVQESDAQAEKEIDPTYLYRNLFLFICVLFAGIFILRYIERRTLSWQKENRQIDSLTGLPNRNYFKEVYGERGVFNTARYKSLAVFDIDFFKEANDIVDGDDVLQSIVQCAQEMLGKEGQLFRWGGDEFTVLMKWSLDEGYELCRDFCKEVEKGGRVTVSVGVTEVRLSDSIKKNYYRAAQGCYLVKEMGGNGVKRN